MKKKIDKKKLDNYIIDKNKFISSIIVLLVLILSIYTITKIDFSKETYVFGNPDAPIVIREYFDLLNPSSRAIQPIISKIMKEYDDEVRIEYKNYPATNIHPSAFYAHRALECSRDLGDKEMKNFMNIIYKNQDLISQETTPLAELSRLGRIQGFGVKFSRCFNTDIKDNIIRQDMSEGRARRITSAPAIFINEKKAPLNYEGIKNLIEIELKK